MSFYNPAKRPPIPTAPTNKTRMELEWERQYHLHEAERIARELGRNTGNRWGDSPLPDTVRFNPIGEWDRPNDKYKPR